MPPSRPQPDCLMPPNGSVRHTPARLTATFPTCKRSATAKAVAASAEYTDAASPNRELLAIAIASSTSS